MMVIWGFDFFGDLECLSLELVAETIKFKYNSRLKPFEMHQFSFERLEVWQHGRTLCKIIYRISQKFPPDERFGATQQIRRAVLSITCNLAEGNSRHKSAEKARYTEIAYGSLMEVLNVLLIAVELQFIGEDIFREIRPLIEEISNKRNRLRDRQLNPGGGVLGNVQISINNRSNPQIPNPQNT